ncbi:MAG: response regulator transcription factor [Fischerella sp.]|jgi:DNA-binding response OmpR family regulator|nr:response regulator transcription factor [Fischerella sp.]
MRILLVEDEPDLVKPFGMAELLARLRALQRRSPQIQPEKLQIANLSLDYGSRTVSYQQPEGDKQVIPLTNKEFQLLEYFMRHPNQILTSEQLRTAPNATTDTIGG